MNALRVLLRYFVVGTETIEECKSLDQSGFGCCQMQPAVICYAATAAPDVEVARYETGLLTWRKRKGIVQRLGNILS